MKKSKKMIVLIVVILSAIVLAYVLFINYTLRWQASRETPLGGSQAVLSNDDWRYGR